MSHKSCDLSFPSAQGTALVLIFEGQLSLNSAPGEILFELIVV